MLSPPGTTIAGSGGNNGIQNDGWENLGNRNNTLLGLVNRLHCHYLLQSVKAYIVALGYNPTYTP